MAIYVTSDAHGHVRALDEALSKISLTSDDTLYVLGDMIDRGPDPVGVINLVRSLPNSRVLKGNHEQIMLTRSLARTRSMSRPGISTAVGPRASSSTKLSLRHTRS